MFKSRCTEYENKIALLSSEIERLTQTINSKYLNILNLEIWI